MVRPPHLLAIGISHYCEKVRWGLRWHGLTYTQENHGPILHMLPTLRKSGQRQVPVLLTDDGPIKDSTAILQWIDQQGTRAPSLYPKQQAEAILSWEERFDQELGPHTRRWAYYYLLQHPETTLPLLKRSSPPQEYQLLAQTFPLAQYLMRKALKITPDSAERSRQKIDHLFQEISQHLEAENPFLVGEQFSAADLTWACLTAPILCPIGYSTPLYTPEQLPEAMAEQIRQWRATPAGRHALICFQRYYFPGWQTLKASPTQN